MILGAGVVIGTVGTNLVMNKILLPNNVGAIPFALPGVNTSQANYMNSLPVALYKFALGAGVGYLLRNASPRIAQGITVGAFAGALSSVLQSSNLLSGLPGTNSAPLAITPTVPAGTSRYLRGTRRGAGAYLPGVPTTFTGPASGFLQRGGAPMRFGQRRGTGAMFNTRNARRATKMIQDPFATS